jgi:hypothetical protein
MQTRADRTGEEFRDDTRPAGRTSTGASVRKRLPADDLARLTRLDPLRSTFAIARLSVSCC